jgi:hypothetical protein
MGRRLHFHHADRMVRAILARARLPDRHDLIPEHSSGQIVFREFTRLNALDSAVVPNTADRAALRSHFTIPVPVFPVRSDASIIRGRADSNMPSTPPCQYGVTSRH